MATNLLNEFYHSAEEIADMLLIGNEEIYDIMPTPGTKQGFSLSHTNSDVHIPNTNVTGFYVIYIDDMPLYVGSSMGERSNTIYNRISRAVKEISNNNSPKENHPAFKKYVYHYGKTFAKLKLKVMSYPLMKKAEANQVEKCLMRAINPLFNKK